MVGGRDEEEEEEEEGARDCFFNSMDRVPSGVSIAFDVLASDSSDGDDVRFSFSSAVAPSSFRRRVSFNISDEDNMEQEEEEEEEEEGVGGGGAGDFDYGIWMAEPISVKERRLRLLQGMGLASRKDIAVGSQSRRIPSRRVPSTRFTSADVGGPTPSLPPEPPPPPPTISQPHPPPITRCRSDPQLSAMRVDDLTILLRSSSAPASISFGRGAAGGGQIVREKEVEMHRGIPVDDQIKNLDAGKEFVVPNDDLQTSIQLTGESDQLIGCSPIDKELMRRANDVIGGGGDDNKTIADNDNYNIAPEAATSDGQTISSKNTGSKPPGGKKKGGWLKNIKCVTSSVTGLISADKEKDHHHNSSNGSERLKVHQHGKSCKELTGLYMCQEIQAHQGSIWTIKFSTDSRYLASAGEDRVVNVWEVLECDILSSSLRRQDQTQSSPPPQPPLPLPKGSSVKQTNQPSKRTKKGVKVSSGSKTNSLPDYIVMPETVFSLSQNPVHSFQGHLDDVLDLSWSKSQCLLSSSMDKTVRLWDLETKACLKLFAHNDYVTCIQFNPLDDRYFISGSLDAKVRIWSIPDRQVVDWSDLHEMVTAACYTPDGQGAIVGSHKGSCRLYNTSDNKLCEEGRIDIQNKKKKSNAKKITGFQMKYQTWFAPGNPSEVLITSADSRIRVFAGVDMVHKFRGFRNTSSQISASCSSDGKYVVCASEDSHVYIWQRNRARSATAGGKGKGWVTTRSHEYFDCKDVLVAIPWPSGGSNCEVSPSLPSWSGRITDNGLQEESPSSSSSSSSSISSSASLRSGGPTIQSSAAASSSRGSGGKIGSNLEAGNAWGLVVVTAGLDGSIRIYSLIVLSLNLLTQHYWL